MHRCSVTLTTRFGKTGCCSLRSNVCVSEDELSATNVCFIAMGLLPCLSTNCLSQAKATLLIQSSLDHDDYDEKFWCQRLYALEEDTPIEGLTFQKF